MKFIPPADNYRNRARSAADQAETWLHGSSEKEAGSVPWRYDLEEARHLLRRGIADIDRALEAAAGL